jgi:hypothetical protein
VAASELITEAVSKPDNALPKKHKITKRPYNQALFTLSSASILVQINTRICRKSVAVV